MATGIYSIVKASNTPASNATSGLTSLYVQGQLDELAAKAAADASDIAALDTRVDTAETDIIAHDGRLDALEADNTTNKTNIATNTTNITNLGTEVDGLSDDVSELQTQVQALVAQGTVVDTVQSKADLDAYPTTGLVNGDMIVVFVDEEKENVSSIYEWNGTAWIWMGVFAVKLVANLVTYSPTGTNYLTATEVQSAINQLDAQLKITNDAATALATRVTTAETDIDDLQADITAVEADVADLDDRVEALEAGAPGIKFKTANPTWSGTSVTLTDADAKTTSIVLLGQISSGTQNGQWQRSINTDGSIDLVSSVVESGETVFNYALFTPTTP